MQLQVLDGHAKPIDDVELEFLREIQAVAKRYLPELEAEGSPWETWAASVELTARREIRSRQ